MAYRQRFPYIKQILYIIRYAIREGVKNWRRKSCLKGK